MAFDLETVETAVLASPIKERAEIPEPAAQPTPDADPAPLPQIDLDTDAPPPAEYMTQEEWEAGFLMAHHMGGAFLGVDGLGAHAQSDMGREAARASYELANSNDTTREWFLSRGSGVIGNTLALAVYGFTTWQMVREARAAKQAQFVRHQEQEETDAA